MPGLRYVELLRAGDAAERAGAALQRLAQGEGSGPILHYINSTALIRYDNKSPHMSTHPIATDAVTNCSQQCGGRGGL